MSDLDSLYFALGLDDTKFNNALEAAKEKIKGMGADVSINLDIDAEKVANAVQKRLDELAKGGVKIKTETDTSGVDRLTQKTNLLNESLKEEAEILEKIRQASSDGQKVPLNSKLQNVQERIAKQRAELEKLKSEVSNEASSPVRQIVDPQAAADINALTEAMKSLNEQMEVSNRLREGQQKANAQSKEEAKQRKISAQWLNETRRQNKEIAQLQKEEEAMRSSVSSKWIEEARQKNAELRKEESAAAKQRVADAKASNKALQSQLSQLFKLEEAIKKLQNLRIRLNFSGIDQNSENFKRAAAALDAYIAKLEELQGSGRILSKREVASVLGVSMKSVIADSDRYVKEQQAIEKSLVKALSIGDGANVAIDKKTAAMNRFQKVIIGTTNWASQLNNQLGYVFSIYSIERFIRSLYTVGGEFQKQQIALQNMIGDAEKADVIFDRMKDLAVTSPFTFSELASYTKQMSAYGIEYEELYDTTKRLADISAGVGVDMSRIILAYGQVRSAEVLRGQELRQFTEAGIPLVAELAKRLEEVRGKSVAVGEVFDAISRREISFGMVKDVLFDMTDPGGRFFETQEKLAESLAGKWSNLKDAWDIMIADIANGSNSTLKSLAEVTAWIVKNWEAWLPLITGAATALGLYRAAMAIVIPLQQAFNVLTSANPWIAIASGVIGAAAAIYGYASNTKTSAEELRKLNLELDKNLQKNKENEQTANRYLNSLKAQNTSEEQRVRLLEELIRLYPSIFEGMTTEQVMLADTIELKKRMAEATKEMTLAEYDQAILDKQNKVDRLRQEDWKRLTTPGRGDKHSQNDEEIDELKSEITALKESREALSKELEWKTAVEGLNDKSTLQDYLDLYGEIGKAIKILRDNGINDETLVKPTQGIPLDEYYDKLDSALQAQEAIMDKFGPDTAMHKNAATAKKVYEQAIKSIGGVIGKRGGGTGTEKEAEEAAKKEVQAYVEALRNEVSRVTDKWSLFKELLEASGNKELSANIAFGGQITFDSQLEQLKSRIMEEAKKFGVGISLDELLGLGEKQLMERGIEEKAAKAIGHLIETYNKENEKLKDESVRNFIEILNASKDFEQQIADVERKLQEDLEDLRKNSAGMPNDEYARRRTKLVKKSEEDISKIRFEEFKESSNWVKVFDDLDLVSNDTLDFMTSQIKEFAKQTSLSQDEVKQLVEAMRKLREETIERNPLKAFKDAWGNLNDLNNAIKGKSNGKVVYTVTSKDGSIKQYSEEDYKQARFAEQTRLSNAALGVVSKFDAVGKAAGILGEFFDSAGSGVSHFLEAISSVASSTISGAQAGASIGSVFGGMGGLYGAIAGAALGMLTSLFQQIDKSLQRAIEASERREKEIGNVAKNLETALERNMGGIFTMKIDDKTSESFAKVLENYGSAQDALKEWNSGEMNLDLFRQIREFSHMQEETIETIREALSEDSYFDAQLAALKVQRDEVQKQMQLEDEKKKTDKDKMLDYEQQIHELDDAINHFAEDMANALYGIDFKDWSEQLAESLVDAWASGEDAVQAYRDTVNDILKDLGVSIISQKIIEPLLDKTMDDFLSQFEKDNGILTDSSLEILAGMAGQAEYAASATEAYLEGLKKLGIDLSETSEEAKSGLSKGIQSVTEDTADLLASYLNAIRQDVSVDRSLMEKLIGEDVPRLSYIAEAQLRELNQIVANTKRNADVATEIRDLFNRVVDKGSNKLKV